MDLELKGRVAIVTGGGMGIGKEVARFLSEEGCKVVICARRMAFLQLAAEEIGAQAGNGTAAVLRHQRYVGRVGNGRRRAQALRPHR